MDSNTERLNSVFPTSSYRMTAQRAIRVADGLGGRIWRPISLALHDAWYVLLDMEDSQCVVIEDDYIKQYASRNDLLDGIAPIATISISPRVTGLEFDQIP